MNELNQIHKNMQVRDALQMIQEQNVSMVVSLTEEAEHQDGDGKIEN